VAPGNEADAVGRIVCLLAKRGDVIRRGHHRFEDHLHRDGGSAVERPRDFLRVGGHLLQGLGPIKVLAAGDKPNFKLFHTFQKKCSRSQRFNGLEADTG
jgi:hypothetical protein